MHTPPTPLISSSTSHVSRQAGGQRTKLIYVVKKITQKRVAGICMAENGCRYREEEGGYGKQGARKGSDMQKGMEWGLRVDLPVHDPALLVNLELQGLPACDRR